MGVELVLGEVVPARRDPPGPAGGGLELGCCPAARPGSARSARRRTRLCVAGRACAAPAGTRREGSAPPRAAGAAWWLGIPGGRRGGLSPRTSDGPTPDGSSRGRRPLRRRAHVPVAATGPSVPGRPSPGLPASPGAFGHVEELAEPRGRHARLRADHLEVLERSSRPSADFFHTRISIAASPGAEVRSVTCSSSCCSRAEGLASPASILALAPSRKSAFHRPMDYSETLFRRAASAIVISPCRTDSTMRVFLSGGIVGGLPMVLRLSFRGWIST